ncbi:unnamed protein product [Cylindrotheca closterium]|uniref:Serine protease n=1 Tax=Cylindrotheca closterium TaxID=2856 RepID=A0AAD2FJH6_9STRA|nr:unnamed protein product [Cylindrotheca closterium]
MRLCSQKYNTTTVVSISLLLLLSSGRVHSQEPRSLRASHKTHICDKDFQPIIAKTDAPDSSSLQPRPKQEKLEYHLNLPQLQEEQDDDSEQRGEDAIKLEYLMALHFNSFELDPRCTLEIRDKHDELVTALSGTGSSFWSEHIKGSSVRLVLNCNEEEKDHAGDHHSITTSTDANDRSPAQFKSNFIIDEYVVIDSNIVQDGNAVQRTLAEVLNEPARNLEICRNDDLKNAQCYEATHPEAFQVANSVVRMKYANTDFCTGWMISPGLLMTAGHCVETTEEVMNTEYQFSYGSSSCTSDLFDTPEIYRPIELVKVDYQSDYALIRMEGNPGFKYGYLELENSLPAVNDVIYIPQHPLGRDIELAIEELSPFNAGGLCSVYANGQGAADSSCEKYGASFRDFAYYCDTEGGSSGAPVLSATSNKVIGIHHCGSTCENFAIPVFHIHNAIISIVTTDILTAVEVAPTMAPTAGSGGNETVLDTPASGAGRTRTGSKLSFSLPSCWALGLLLLLSSLIVAI